MPGGGGYGDPKTRDPETVVPLTCAPASSTVQRRRVNMALSSEKGSMSIRPGQELAERGAGLIVVSLAESIHSGFCDFSGMAERTLAH